MRPYSAAATLRSESAIPACVDISVELITVSVTSRKNDEVSGETITQLGGKHVSESGQKISE